MFGGWAGRWRINRGKNIQYIRYLAPTLLDRKSKSVPPKATGPGGKAKQWRKGDGRSAGGDTLHGSTSSRGTIKRESTKHESWQRDEERR